MHACLLLSAALGLTACDKVPLTAPTNTTIRLNASVTTVATGGTLDITAVVIESAGTPVQNGTVVTFSSSLGSTDPHEARTTNGQATVRYLAGAQSGTAKVSAFSGGSKSDDLEILVGAAGAGAVSLRADSTILSTSGSTVDVIATVVDTGGNPLRGAPVQFSTSVGQLSQSTAVSNDAGEARTQLTSNQDSKVTARVGAGTNAREATLDFVARDAPVVAISVPAIGGVNNVSEAGLPTVFTLKPTVGKGITPIRDVHIDFGDGASASLGALTGDTTISHIYGRTGSYTVRVNSTDTLGNTGTSTMALTVNDRGTVTLTVTGVVSSGGIVNFTAGATVPPGSGPIQRLEWDFGDGRSATTTGLITAHQYAVGNYTVRVTAVTTTGHQGYAETSIRVTAF